MADLRRESGVAFDPVLKGSGHVVERAGEPTEVVIGFGLEAGVELAGGDRLGGLADLARGVRAPVVPPSQPSIAAAMVDDDGPPVSAMPERLEGVVDVAERNALSK